MEIITELTPVFLHTLPDNDSMVLGKIYISREFKLAKLLCPDGCGCVSVIPFDYEVFPHNHWKMTEKDGKVTFQPSVLARNCPNKSHYFITDNKIQWV